MIRLKKMIGLIMALLMLMSAAGCSSEEDPPIRDAVQPQETQTDAAAQEQPLQPPELLELRQGVFDQDVWCGGRLAFDISWEGIYADGQRWPLLAERLEKIRARRNEDYYSAGLQLYGELEELLAQEPDHPGYASHHDSYIQRADEHILSIREEYYGFTGGVHPNTVMEGTNLDPKTGEVLLISDVLTDISDLRKLLARKIGQKYPDAAFYEPVEDMLEQYSDNMLQWTMDYQSIRFYFSPYEMASYADGPQIVELWFWELGDLLPEKYRAIPAGGSSQKLPLNIPVTVDLDPEDGAVDEILLQPVPVDAFGTYGHVDITVNGQLLQGPDIFAYEYIPYLMCVPAEDSYIWYIYIHSQYEGICPQLQIWSVTPRSAVWYGQIEDMGFAGSWEQEFAEGGAILRRCPLDPSSFWIGHPVFVMGTYDAAIQCSLDLRTGMPSRSSQQMQLIEEYSRETLVPLEVLILPQETPETIPGGTLLRYLRILEDRYLVVALPDGREAKLLVEYDGGIYTVNGYEEFDLFREIWYEG